MNQYLYAVPLIASVSILFGLLVVVGHVIRLRERVVCHTTGKTFEASDIREIGNGFAWVKCEVCDANGYQRGETAYDRTAPAWHMIVTGTHEKTADAANIDGFKTEENL